MEGLLPIAALHLLACLSPGPDILLVARTRLSEGRSAALATVAGILLGVSLHVALGLTGLSFLMAKGDAFVALLSLAGGAWLIYMGIAGWPKGRPSPDRTAAIAPATLQRCFQRGLIVNLLNPKAFLYFVSLFSTLLGPELDPSHRALAASSLILVQFGAFSLVAVLLPEPSSAPQWAALQRLAQVLISLLFIGIGIWIWGTALIERLP